jgi:hypothetical protein
VKQARDDPKTQYGRLSEEYLNSRNRTMDINSKEFTPFVFAEKKSTSFVSFSQCFAFWAEKAEADPTIDLMELFGM